MDEGNPIAPVMFTTDVAAPKADRCVYVVDDDAGIRRSTSLLFRSLGYEHRPYVDGTDFIDNVEHLRSGCVLLDVRMPFVGGLDVLARLKSHRDRFPIIVMTGHGDIETAVRAMKLGALDFLEKPFSEDVLLLALDAGFNLIAKAAAQAPALDASAIVAKLTARQRDVLIGVEDGLSNKQIALRLGIAARTVEMHRANLMARFDAHNLAELLKKTMGVRLRDAA